MPLVKGVPLSHIWMYKRYQQGPGRPLDYACYHASPICDARKSPRHRDGTKALHYAYHFDALRIADYLRRWSCARGVTHIEDDIVHTELDGDGNIESLRGASGRSYEADLYLDCTGFAGLLIEKALGEPKLTFHDCLLTDRAVAINIPEAPEEEGIRPYTTASAFSFLEPLESTGLYFVYAALYQLVSCFPNKHIDSALRDRFNERVAYMVDDVRDFIVLHFCTSPRTDTPYWRANQHELKLPDTLKEILALQKAGVPIRKSYHGNETLYASFEAGFDRFWTNSNFQSIFAGVGYLSSQPMPLLRHRPDILDEAEQVFHDIQSKTAELMAKLPSQHEYLTALYARGAR
jgi:hypothetical protein